MNQRETERAFGMKPDVVQHHCTGTQAEFAQLLESRRSRRGLAAQVRGKVIARLDDPPGMDDIAHQLRMDERTLRRKLTAEGVSFRELVDEVRSMLAIEMLSNADLTAEEVAVRLGYNDGAAFSRAFKRWTGSSPGRYRIAPQQPDRSRQSLPGLQSTVLPWANPFKCGGV